MNVLLAGAHGRLGERILALLLHRGHRVRALVRTDAQADALRGVGAEAVLAKGDGPVPPEPVGNEDPAPGIP